MININVLLKRLSTKTSIFLLIFIVFVALFSYEQINKTFVYPNIVVEVNSSFLSKEYFDELTLAYEQIRSSNKKWYILNNSKAIASHAILTQMMLDLQLNQAILNKHELFNTFFDTFDFHVRQLPVMTEEIHYFRNQLNTYSGAPEQIEDMLNLAFCDKWQLFSGTYHRYTVDDYDAAYNVKFISSNGRFEAVYNIKTGSLIEDAVNMGTYNYAPGSIVPWKYIKHYKYDKLAWKKWGNTQEMSYYDINNRQSRHGSTEQKQSSNELKALIENMKSNSYTCR